MYFKKFIHLSCVLLLKMFADRLFLEQYMIDQLLTESLIWSFQRYFVCDVAVIISECSHAFIRSFTVTGDLGILSMPC